MTSSPYTLHQLNQMVTDAVNTYLPNSYWVQAETSDVRRNQNGHCYLEFVEKDRQGKQIIARARGAIWSSNFLLITSFFKEVTGQDFASNMKVLVRVTVDFHPLYGFSLTVVDIDPTYTLGDIARNREMILQQLKEEGVLTLNKELLMPKHLHRIAVISSPTAAGYEDFKHQLDSNEHGFKYYSKLFPAIMQGDRAEASIIEALDKIFIHKNYFDVVVIIRGGGASADLHCFDSYLLAANCAQFPLPIISGIGHERDITVIDEVAHTRAKTPTAAAELIIAKTVASATLLMEYQQRLIAYSIDVLQTEKQCLTDTSRRLIQASHHIIRDQIAWMKESKSLINFAVQHNIQKEKYSLEVAGQFLKMVSPENILKRGYTITLKNGHVVKSIDEINVGDKLLHLLADGKILSQVTIKNEDNKEN